MVFELSNWSPCSLGNRATEASPSHTSLIEILVYICVCLGKVRCCCQVCEDMTHRQGFALTEHQKKVLTYTMVEDGRTI